VQNRFSKKNKLILLSVVGDLVLGSFLSLWSLGIYSHGLPTVGLINGQTDFYVAGSSQLPDFRVKVNITLHNWGYVDAYAAVNIYTIWDSDGDNQTQMVFVPARSSMNVTADLKATNQQWWYGARVLSVERGS